MHAERIKESLFLCHMKETSSVVFQQEAETHSAWWLIA